MKLKTVVNRYLKNKDQKKKKKSSCNFKTNFFYQYAMNDSNLIVYNIGFYCLNIIFF